MPRKDKPPASKQDFRSEDYEFTIVDLINILQGSDRSGEGGS